MNTQKDEAIKNLRRLLKPGQTVYTVLRNCSPSGMTRRIDIYKMKGNAPFFLTGIVATAAGYRHAYDKPGGGLVVSGCGMDVGFEVVYNLGRVLWPNGDGKFKTGRNGMKGPETDGGYLLRHRWL